jgi:hypothetical protein
MPMKNPEGAPTRGKGTEGHLLNQAARLKMTALLWDAAVFLTLAGALFYWGAGVLRVEGFYGGATGILGLALLCAGLAQTWPRWGAWLNLLVALPG